MRTKLIVLTAALLCSAPLARAQQAETTEPAGIADVGVRAGSMDGDEARYQRYQDLRNGVFSRISFGKVTDTTILEEVAKIYRDGGWPAAVEGEAQTAPFSAPSAGPPPWHVFRFTFDTIVGVATAEPWGAMRWQFAR